MILICVHEKIQIFFIFISYRFLVGGRERAGRECLRFPKRVFQYYLWQRLHAAGT